MRFILAFFLSFSAFSYEALSIKGFEGEGVQEKSARGRGVAISKTHVLTVLHVVSGDDNVTPRRVAVEVDGKWVEGKVVGFDASNDLALLSFECKLGPIVEPLDMPKLETVGNKALLPSKHMLTAILAFYATPEDLGAESGVEAHGLSGSPVIIEGKLIGLVSAAGQRVRRVKKDLGDGRFELKDELYGPVLEFVIGPEPIKQLLANHIKNDTKE